MKFRSKIGMRIGEMEEKEMVTVEGIETEKKEKRIINNSRGIITKEHKMMEDTN